MRIAIINNYPGDIPTKRKDGFEAAFAPLRPTLEYSVIPFAELNNKDRFQAIMSYDGLLYSGSPKCLSETDVIAEMQPVLQLIRNFPNPQLGICFGHQLIGKAFGFEIADLEAPFFQAEFKKIIQLKIHKPIEILPPNIDNITVEMVHHQEIKYKPKFETQFTNHASTTACKLQFICHSSRPIFGVQFHPETIEDRNAQIQGQLLLQNFVQLCERH
jgi:GMP synthase-like glutamine amidotransferase